MTAILFLSLSLNLVLVLWVMIQRARIGVLEAANEQFDEVNQQLGTGA